ncbi:hypothetical protein B0H14DRAFT_2830659, partial [Mycena olivaceomarginata]
IVVAQFQHSLCLLICNLAEIFGYILEGGQNDLGKLIKDCILTSLPIILYLSLNPVKSSGSIVEEAICFVR